MITTDIGGRLRSLRENAGLSQSDLGRRAGIPQSAISRYESGSKTPTLSVLERVVEAAGYDVTFAFQPTLLFEGAFEGPVGRRVQPRRAALRSLFAEAGATFPRVFGSVSRGEDREDSDLDVVVDLPDGMGLVGWAALARQASDIAGVEVDLVPRDGLTADVARAVARDGVPV